MANNIFNHTSEDMHEIPSNSIDLIIGSPPYNIGTRYGSFEDNVPFQEYKEMLKRVIKECARVLKDEGILILEAADSIYSNGRYIQLAGLLQKLCLDSGLHIQSRHINFTSSENHVEMLEHDWNPDYSTTGNAHSNCHQLIIFSKTERTFREGEIHYVSYKPTPGHPCPTPLQLYHSLLDCYFTKGMRVLDPFMGTAILGREIQKRGGTFHGYEISPEIFAIAEMNLKQ
jgi:DNA modification methylase